MLFLCFCISLFIGFTFAQQGTYLHTRDAQLSIATQNLSLCTNGNILTGFWAGVSVLYGTVSGTSVTGTWLSTATSVNDEYDTTFAMYTCDPTAASSPSCSENTLFSNGANNNHFFNHSSWSGSFNFQFAADFSSFSGSFVLNGQTFPWTGSLVSDAPVDMFQCASSTFTEETLNDLLGNNYGLETGGSPEKAYINVCPYSEVNSLPVAEKLPAGESPFMVFDSWGTFSGQDVVTSGYLYRIPNIPNALLGVVKFPGLTLRYPAVVLLGNREQKIFSFTFAFTAVPGTLLSFSPPPPGPGAAYIVRNVWRAGDKNPEVPQGLATCPLFQNSQPTPAPATTTSSSSKFSVSALLIFS